MARKLFAILSTLALLATFVLAAFWPNAFWLFIFIFIFILPFIGLGLYDMLQRKHTILRLYPVIGRLRYVFESIRPEIQQYFVESDTNGKPISREFRELVYQRAKGQRDTRPFGTVFRIGYSFVDYRFNNV